MFHKLYYDSTHGLKLKRFWWFSSDYKEFLKQYCFFNMFIRNVSDIKNQIQVVLNSFSKLNSLK